MTFFYHPHLLLRSLVLLLALTMCQHRATAQELPPDTLFRSGLPHFSTLDPLDTMDELHASVFADLFEGLVETTPEGTIAPAIAKDWEISPDAKTYTFALRSASWSNGQPIVAQHFVDAVRRALSPSSQAAQASMLYPIVNAEAFHRGDLLDPEQLGVYATDEHTLSIVLHTPTPHFMTALSYRYLTPLLDQRYDYSDVSTDNLRRLPYNGAYLATEHISEQSISLVKNPGYWAHDDVSIPKVKYRLNSLEQQWEDYRQNKLDYLQIIPIAAFDWARDNIPAEILIAPQFSTYFYEMDLRVPELADLRVRQALNMSLDRERLAEVAIQPGHLPSSSVVPPHLLNYEPARPVWAKQTHAERIHRAQSLLSEAGYGKQKPLKIRLAFNTSSDHQRIAEAVAQQWQAHLPVEINLRSQPWRLYKQARLVQEAGAINRYGWSGDYMDPLAFLALWLPESPINYMQYDNADYQAWIQQASITQDTKKRYRLLQQAEQQLLQDSVILPLFHYTRRSAIKPRIYDWEANTGIVLMSKYLSIQQAN